MSVRKQVLEVLTRTRLKQIGSKLGKDYAASAKKGDVVNSLNRTRSIPLADILGKMMRDELKRACKTLEIDSSGREKKVLIRRLLAVERAAQRTNSLRNGTGRGKRSGATPRSGSAKTNAHTGIKSSGKSNFLNGVDLMDDPKVVGQEVSGGAAKRDGVQHAELVWPGKRLHVNRIVLPFQCIETVNESRATRESEKGTMFHSQTRQAARDAAKVWRNKLIWGDNKYVVGSLLEEFAGKVDLIYIDPPFASGQDFSYQVKVGQETLSKEPSIIEEKAYRDTWGQGLASYLQMMYERLCLMRELLSERGSLYLHLDDHVSHYLKIVADQVFGPESFLNEIVWQRTNAHNMKMRYLPRVHDVILLYAKSNSYTWNTPMGEHSAEQLKRYKPDDNGRLYTGQDLTVSSSSETRRDTWRGSTPPPGRSWAASLEERERLWREGRILTKRDGTPRLDGYKVFLDEKEGRKVCSVWTDIGRVGNTSGERLEYATQKPEALLERIIDASSNEGDLIADFFCGSGTTGAVAEKKSRRWLMCDLSRWSLHVARKRLLDIEHCNPFEVLNLGKYERQYWQGTTFGDESQKALHHYVKFILDLYKAEPVSGLVHIHGQSAGYMVHVGAADAPITLAEIRDAVDECKKIEQAKLDILGWEWEMGLHDVVEAESQRSGVKLRLLQIPRECMDMRAAEAGDVHFYELAYLEVRQETKGKSHRLKLKNFVIPNPELIPDEVRKKVKKWSDFIDYWAVDFDFKDDTFHNQWQDYRTRAKRDLDLMTDWHEYESRGQYRVLVKVFDIFGNDTTHLLEVQI